MPKKIIPIKYTNRDFSSIRESLLEHAKRYYPNTYRDFNEAGFGSLMIDTVSYVGDVLSFYLDYQANESFLETAAEYENVLKLSKFLGFSFNKAPSSYGTCQFYALVPVSVATGGPDTRYSPTLKAGSTVATAGGVSFTLLDDVSFADSVNEVIVAKVNDDTGAPTYFAVKAEGRIVSGELLEHVETVDAFERFLKVVIPGDNVSAIVQVTDSEGHEYFEVEHLSQNSIYKPVTNKNAKNDSVPNILKKIAVPRRFAVEHLDDTTTIQFGYGSENELVSGSIADPANVALKRHAREYISDTSIDPTKLTSTDKFGVAPANTMLSVVYRSNTSENVNAGSGQVNRVVDAVVDFDNVASLNEDIRRYVVNSIEVSNEDPIVGDISIPGVEELKIRALGNFSAQNRAVTRQDYISMAYAMPGHFGAIKRCTIFRDNDSFKRNLNMYVISENAEGHLVRANNTIKQNLKTWLNGVRMINDTIDILDAFIINVGVEFDIVIEENANKYEVLRMAQLAIEEQFLLQREMGEPIVVSDFFKALKDVEEIVDVVSVRVVNKSGSPYSSLDYDIKGNSSKDGRVIYAPRTAVFELKYPEVDIKGKIV